MKMRSLRTILNSMVNWVRISSPNLTNWTPGSVIRTILETLSMEIESIYFQMHKGFRWALENSIFHSFGFTKLPATFSTGKLLIGLANVTEPLIIPKGTIYSTIPIDSKKIVRFEVTGDVAIAPFLDSIEVPVKCTVAGSVGNVPANTIRIPLNPLAPYRSITNPVGITGGMDEETSKDRKLRFNKFIKSLSKGTLEAIKYGVMEVQPTEDDLEGVAGVYATDVVGLVFVYAHDNDGNLSPSLKKRIEDNLINYRSAGIEVVVSPVNKISVDLNVSILLAPNIKNKDLYREHIESVLISYLNSFPVSKSLIQNDLIRFVMSVGSGAVINMTSDLKEDIEISNTYNLIRAGRVTVKLFEEVVS